MAINWNINQIETRSGGRVLSWTALGVHIGDDSLELYEVITVDHLSGRYRKYVVDSLGYALERGFGTSPDDIVQKEPPKPPAPREVVRWTHPGVFDAGGALLWTRSTAGEGAVRVRIIEEPEPPQS